MSWRAQASPIRLVKSFCFSRICAGASGRYQASTLTASPPIRLILATDQSSISLDSRPSGVSSNTESSSVTIRPLAGDRFPMPRGMAKCGSSSIAEDCPCSVSISNVLNAATSSQGASVTP